MCPAESAAAESSESNSANQANPTSRTAEGSPKPSTASKTPSVAVKKSTDSQNKVAPTLNGVKIPSPDITRAGELLDLALARRRPVEIAPGDNALPRDSAGPRDGGAPRDGTTARDGATSRGVSHLVFTLHIQRGDGG